MTGISDETLDALLRREFEGSVEDDGFSARLMRTLPARRTRRQWLMPGLAFSGGLLTWISLLPTSLPELTASASQTGGLSAAVASICALMLTISVLACGWALDEG